MSQLEKHRKILKENLPEICRVDPDGDGAYPRMGDPSENLPNSPVASPRSGAVTASGRRGGGVSSPWTLEPDPLLLLWCFQMGPMACTVDPPCMSSEPM